MVDFATTDYRNCRISLGCLLVHKGTTSFYKVHEGFAKMNILQIYFFIIGVGIIICIFNWRTGLVMSIIMGFLQDPIRKLVTDAPIYLTVIAGAFLSMSALGAF